jgi:L-ascorbate metabolism protein UlaG (beta-lactamase superfamily)
LKITAWSLLFVFPITPLCAKDFSATIEKMAQKTFITNEPTIWHLNHSGFAIKTKKHFLIFDYCDPRPAAADKKGLAAGVIDPEEIRDENVLVFVSHEHDDHFNPAIASWQQGVGKIKYIVSPEVAKNDPNFADKVKTNLIEADAGPKVIVEGVAITTIKATDSGVGFMIECDGLTVFHAGDHALWGRDAETAYQTEIIKLKGAKIDIAFLPLQPFHPNKEVIREGAVWAVKELTPNTVVPMHLFGQYAEGYLFVETIREQKLSSQGVCMSKRGQAYQYTNGSLKEK